MIRLETSRRTGIENAQLSDVSAFERNWASEIPKRHPRVIARTDLSPIYNCHGLTFASRRTRITEPEAIERILSDDKWDEVDVKGILPGDVVVYFSPEGEPNHSGIIISVGDLAIPQICSKWGNAGEYIHFLNDCPSLYGPVTRFYRCRL